MSQRRNSSGPSNAGPVVTHGNLTALRSGQFIHLLEKLDSRATKDRQTLVGHTSSVRSVAFSPDVVTLASGSDDKTVILWSAATGQKKLTLVGHSGAVWSVAFSPDGKTLASGSGDKTVILWDVVSGEKKKSLAGHTNIVRSVIFSPDGATLASGSGDKTVLVWEAESGQKKKTLTGHTIAVCSVTFSLSGTLLASGSADNTVILWDADTGEKKQTFVGHSDSVRSVAFSPSGATLASGSDDKTVVLWDVETGQKVQTLTGHTIAVCSLSFSLNGATLASGSADNTVILWDAETGEKKQTFLGHMSAVCSVAFSSDGATLASGSADSTVSLWDAGSWQKVAVHGPFLTRINSVSFDSDGALLMTDGSGKLHRLPQASQSSTATNTKTKTMTITETAAGTELEAKIQQLQSELADREQRLLVQSKQLCSKEAELSSLQERMDEAIRTRDEQINSLTAMVTALQAKLSSTGGPLPVWDLRAPYLWNGALFARDQDHICSVSASVADPRLSGVWDFFSNLMATRGRYSATFEDNPVAGFRLDRVELWRDLSKNQQSLVAAVEAKVNRLRAAPVPEVERMLAVAGEDAEKRALMEELKSLFFTCGAKKKCNIVHVFHGTRVELVDSILKNGLLALTREDAGYFGHGCYTTPSIEYAARYATGELCAGGARPPDSSGCWPVIVFAALVGITYPLSRDVDYAKPKEKTSNSKFFGKTLVHGVVDSHVVGVSRANQFQASNDAASTDYLELVCKEHHLLPLGVLWLRK